MWHRGSRMLTQAVTYLRSMEWRTYLRDPFLQGVVGLFGLASMVPVLMTVVPPTWHLLPQTYLVWMVGALTVGVLVSARWWVVWLVGTLLWSLAWLVGCLWSISQLVQR